MKEDKKHTIGSEPSKIIYGNTKDHPDNVRDTDHGFKSEDDIIKGARKDKLPQRVNGTEQK